MLISPMAPKLCLLVAGMTLSLSSVTMGNHHGPLEAASRAYRDQVQAMERLVHRTRYLDRYDVRLVERLENASCDFHGATFDPSDRSRLMYQWGEVQSLHSRAELALFGSATYPVNTELMACWDQVAMGYAALAVQLGCVTNHSHPYSKLPLPRRDPIDGSMRANLDTYRDSIATPINPSHPNAQYPSNSAARDFPNRDFQQPPIGRRDVGVVVVESLLNRLIQR